MSTLAIVLICVGAALLLLLVGGFLATRRRTRMQAGAYERHIAEADRALQEARAADKGWDPAVLQAAARKALEDARPGFSYQALHLVLVDDRPGVRDDRAHFVAVGEGDEARVVLARHEEHWTPERVD